MMEAGITAFAALLLVLGLLIGLMWAAKRFRLVPGTAVRTGAARELELKETLPLSTNTRLAVVRWRGTDMLIAVGPEGATRIAGPQKTAAPADGDGPPLDDPGTSFQDHLTNKSDPL